MSRAIYLTILTAFLTVATVSSGRSANAGDPKRVVVYSGGEVTANSWVSYSGAVLALDGDLAKAGISLRAFFLSGEYDYKNALVTNGEVDADLYLGDVMIGYTGVFNGVWLGLYGGVEFADHDLSPNDPNNRVNGNKVGAKVIAELTTVGNQPLYMNAFLSYSSGFGSYFNQFQTGITVREITFGPELAVLGDKGWSAFRYGGFVKTPIDLSFLGLPSGKLSLSGGYQNAKDASTRGNSSSGSYGTFVYKVLY